MDYKLEELIDIPLLQSLQEKLNLIYSFPSAIIDNEGKVLTAVAWQDICTKFHRINPECLKECIKSDLYVIEHMYEARPAVCYQCPHGLVENATPIIIEGKHLGNFFTGQFFLEKPQMDFFRKQAKTFGFDEIAYLEAVEKVPIWTQKKLHLYLDFIKGFIEIIAGIGYKNLKEIEINKSLRMDKERNLAIINSTFDWIWEIDEEGKYCYSSDRIEKILGYTSTEIIGKTPFDLMPVGDRDQIKVVFYKIIEEQKPIIDLENWNIHKDGHQVCLLTNGFPIFDDTGKLSGYRGVDKDITERKQAEKELFNNVKRHQTIIQTAMDGFWMVDLTGKILEVNNSYCHMSGYSSREILTMSVSDLQCNESQDKVKERIQQIIKHGEMRFESRHIRKDRSIFFVEVSTQY